MQKKAIPTVLGLPLESSLLAYIEALSIFKHLLFFYKMYIIVQTSDFLKKIYLTAVVMLKVGQLFRTILSFIENQFLSEQIYDNRYNPKKMPPRCNSILAALEK